jgi:hypothetical protein
MNLVGRFLDSCAGLGALRLGGRCLALCLFLPLFGCGTGSTGGPTSPRRPRVEARDTRIVHEACPVGDSGAVREDINGDGRPDRTSVRLGQGRSCKSLDFNFDGTIDAWVYLDPNGALQRRESDYDRDGRVDEVEVYERGVLSKRERATSLAGKLDTWQYYVDGKIARAERDANGDEYVDQWWEYPVGRSEDCPLIHSDVDGDGHPDPGATVDVCRDQYAAVPREAPPGESGRDGVRELPTQIEQPPDAAGASEPPSAPGAGSEAPVGTPWK